MYPCTPLDVAQFVGMDAPPTFADFYGMRNRIVAHELVEPFDPFMPEVYVWQPAACVDCTERGTKNKPSFWPNDHI